MLGRCFLKCIHFSNSPKLGEEFAMKINAYKGSLRSIKGIFLGLMMVGAFAGISCAASSSGNGNASSNSSQSTPADGYSDPSSSCSTSTNSTTSCTQPATSESGGFFPTNTNPGQGDVNASEQAHQVANCNSDVQGKDCQQSQTETSSGSGGSAPVVGGPVSSSLNPTTMGNGRQTRNFIK